MSLTLVFRGRARKSRRVRQNLRIKTSLRRGNGRGKRARLARPCRKKAQKRRFVRIFRRGQPRRRHNARGGDCRPAQGRSKRRRQSARNAQKSEKSAARRNGDKQIQPFRPAARAVPHATVRAVRRHAFTKQHKQPLARILLRRLPLGEKMRSSRHAAWRRHRSATRQNRGSARSRGALRLRRGGSARRALARACREHMRGGRPQGKLLPFRRRDDSFRTASLPRPHSASRCNRSGTGRG